jgi:hypothetical protein
MLPINSFGQLANNKKVKKEVYLKSKLNDSKTFFPESTNSKFMLQK